MTEPNLHRGAWGSGPSGRAATFGLLFAFALAMLWVVGAFGSGFGGFEDEPAHLVTALMLRDWLVAGLEDPSTWARPKDFATDYYVHYPKVAIGQWPPVFHGLLALWMLAAGTTTVAIGVFLGLLAALAAYTVFATLRPLLGWLAAMLGGVALLTVPIVQLCSASAMTEIPVALFGLLAVLAFGRFMETGAARCCLWFAGLSVVTILTKGSGLALALVPPIAMVLGGRLDLLGRPVLWGSALLVGALTAPWYWFTVAMTQESWGGGTTPSWDYAQFAARSFAGWLPSVGGGLALVLAPVGLWLALGARWRRAAAPGTVSSEPAPPSGWVAIAAWLLALAALHLTIPSSVEERHLSVFAPGWILFACLGAVQLSRPLRGRLGVEGAAAAGVALFALAGAVWNGRPPVKATLGWESAVRGIGDESARLLIASDPVGEGLFVAGVALADDRGRPNRIVLRASKVLCDAGWSGRDYERRFATVAEMGDWLDQIGVGTIVIDLSITETRHWYEHMQQLVALTHGDARPIERPGAVGRARESGAWTRLGVWDLTRSGELLPGQLVAFRRAEQGALPTPELTLPMVRGE